MAKLDGRSRGLLRAGADECHGAAGEYRGPLDTFARSDRLWRTARNAHAPDVAAVDVVLVGREDQFLTLVRKGDMLHLEAAGSQGRRGAALDRDGIQMQPAIALPRKHDAVA